MRRQSYKKITKIKESDREHINAEVIRGPDNNYSDSLLVRFDTLTDLVLMRDKVKTDTNGRGAKTGGWLRAWSDYRYEVITGKGSYHKAMMIQQRVAKMTATATMHAQWGLAPAGCYPLVPAAVGGDPYCMRIKEYKASELGPVKIYIPMTCSAAVDDKEFSDLLADVLAAAKSLSEVRTVELVAYGSLDADDTWWDGRNIGAFFCTVPIEYRFGDYSSLAVWCDRSMGRTVMMAICGGLLNWHGLFPWEESPNKIGIIERYRAVLGLGDQDIMLPPTFGHNDQAQLRKNMRKICEESGIDISI